MTGPGDRAATGSADQNSDTVADGTDTADDGRGRSRLRGSLTYRRAKGLSRLSLRNWRIRTRLIALLLLPVMVSLVLGGLRVQTSMQNSSQLAQMTDLADLAQKATALADALETERDISAGPLTANPGKQDPDVIDAQKRSDQLSKAFATSADKFDELDLAGGKALLLQVRKDLNQLSEARGSAYTSQDNIQPTILNYDVIIKGLISITEEIAIASNSTELIKVTRALSQFALSKENTSMQRALIAAALARRGGADLSTSDETFGIRLQISEESALANFTAIYGDDEARRLRAPMSFNQTIADTDRYTQQVLNTNGIRQSQPRTYTDWYDAASAKINQEQRIETQLLEVLDGKAQKLQSDADTQTLLNAALIAVVLIVAIAGAAIVARSMVRSLTRLQAAAEDVAERRLPELVKTLSESDPHDVDVTVEPVGVDSTDEIGHVAHAFDMVHREAVRLAAEQALLRGNINAMFTNLSRRSQGLIQRQLSLISELESREADPDQLASLFKLDHLATRMRRNGENLLVLAGEDPGRRWTRPVPLVDVLRAAASEVEQYERIELAAVPSTEVAGRVVNDLVHLLAELLENATSFSSPQTRVRVTGHALPDGRVLVEIHDTGIGLSPDDLADINERLANPPTVDVSVSRRMGLFVVGRLSLRHGIRIQLRPSDSGGTTALVMLPVDVANSADRRPGRPGQGGAAGKQRGLAPTPRQGNRASAAEALAGRAAAALGQAPAGAPQGGGRPQLGQGQQGGPQAPQQPQQNQQNQQPGIPAQGGRGPGSGLPTREAGQALRENGAPGQPGQGGPQGQGGQPQQRRVPGASGAPGVQGGPGGLPRRGPQPEQSAPAGGPAERRPMPERPRQGDGPQTRGERPQPGFPGEPGRPARPQQPQQQMPQRGQAPFAPGEPSPVESTVQFSRPQFEASDIDPRDPLGLGLVEPVLPDPSQQMGPGHPYEQPAPQQAPQQRQQPMALPTGPGVEDTQQWFRPDESARPAPEQARQRPQQYQQEQQYRPQRPGTTAPGFDPSAPPQPQRPQAPQQGQQQPQSRPQQPGGPLQGGPRRPEPQNADQQRRREAPDAPWRPSANDERWRRAEQVREPSTSGLTTSGLPRRTPQANLVSGTAEAAPLTGPQVSRSPEEVRGRLTNLRRGIQQGRQAGQGQPPAQGQQQHGFDGFGQNHQER